MLKKQIKRTLHQQGFIQAALLFGIALITAVLGGFALANRSPTSQTDAEQAKAIVAYRESNGPFTAVDELLEVKGIGKALLEKNRDRLSIN